MGQAEEALLAGRFADAYAVYRQGITAFVAPVRPDTEFAIRAGYATRLARDPTSVPALTGAAFACWVFSDYAEAIRTLDDLLRVRPEDICATLFRGSSRLLGRVDTTLGVADLERAIELDPASPDVHYVVADAFTHGKPDPERALAEASRALADGLDTPRIHAILASAHRSAGHEATAAAHIGRHVDLVATDLRVAPPLEAGTSQSLDLAPGRVHELPLRAVAGERIVVETSSPDITDSIAVLIAPDGRPVSCGDDEIGAFAAIDWPAEETATYRLRATSFEAVETGTLEVTRS